jgi:heparan-alpha-glucosaminide N-acetyltransferase
VWRFCRYNRGINHSPWDNFTLADFVMPWFLFMVGAAMAFSLRKFAPSNERSSATLMSGLVKISTRSLKLFALGVLMQGGGWPDSFRYGYDLSTLRPCGILQRIAIAYFVVALVELLAQRTPRIAQWLVPASRGAKVAALRPHIALFTDHAAQWITGFAALVLYLAIVYAVPVPDWSVEVGAAVDHGFNASALVVPCGGVRGAIHSPACWAGGYVDRIILGQKHIYHPAEKIRLAVCSSCSPSLCPLPLKERPVWCDAPAYDPEGILATVPTVLSTVIGLHFGRAAKDLATAKARVAHWSIFSAVLIVLGGVIHFAGDPINKQRWSPSCVASSLCSPPPSHRCASHRRFAPIDPHLPPLSLFPASLRPFRCVCPPPRPAAPSAPLAPPPSYVFFMAGTCGAALTFVYLVVDVLLPSPRMARLGGPKLALPFFPFVAMGMNAILFFVFNVRRNRLPGPTGTPRGSFFLLLTNCALRHGTFVSSSRFQPRRAPRRRS